MKPFFAFCLFLFVSFFGFSQYIDLRITDSISNEPLPFVTVYLKKSGIGTMTDFKGEARIEFPNSEIELDTLICSYISYKKARIVVNLRESRHLEVQLKQTFLDISEVTVVASKKQLSAKQIVKKVLKNTSKNYASSPVNLIGFYRETLKEDNKAIYLNEATINIHYDQYPQGKFERRDWTDWFYDDSYAFEFNYSDFDGFPNQFNSKDDRVQLIEARSSKNWSQYGFKGSIVGGPLNITSKDYVKYQSDFLDSRNFNKYAYEKSGIESINGNSCYVIHFYPLETGKRMVMDFSKKLRRSIYVGKMYVDRSSFAVVKMEFQLANNVDFHFYSKFLPLDYTIEIDYKLQEQTQTWSLDRIKLNQLRSYKMWSSQHKVLYEGTQEVFFTQAISDSVAQIPLDLEWRHTRMTALRDYEVPYHSDYWRKYENEGYPPLPSSIVDDLTSEESLEKQFNERFKQKSDLPAPTANRTDFTFQYPNETITDSYQWFSDPSKSTDFYQYLEAENNYADNFIISARNHQKNFYNSIYKFFPEDTTQIPKTQRAGNIIYDSDSLENEIYYEYIDSTKRIPILNLSEFISKRRNCFVQDIKFAKNRIAIQYTQNGGLNNRLIVLDKGSVTVQDSLSEIYSYAWLNDSTLYYAQNNAIKRSDKLFIRNIALRTSSLKKTELDLTYDISLSESISNLYCIIQSKDESEIYALSKTEPNAKFELILPRKEGVFNEIKEFGGVIYALTNENALNNRILVRQKEEWKEVVSHSKKRLINDFIFTDNYIVLNTFRKGLSEIIYKAKRAKKWTILELPSEVHNASFYPMNGDSIRIVYSNPRQPSTAYNFDLKKEELSTVKSLKIKRNYEWDLKFIKTERLWAKSVDGVKVPITLSKHRSPKRKHKGLILKVYGSYGAYPGGTGFSAEDLILMKDGFTIAYAHVRGGSILGKQWYLDGKLLNKENSFNDYIACAEYLIKKGHTDANHLVGYGQSAGGLVMGVVINRRPELFNTVILDHAFLDVLTTMMNDTLPLTTDEYKEFGNPQEQDYFDYIRAYSPYQNISKQDYPNLLFIASSNDYQTPTWQIAKCAAKLRELNMGETTLLLKTGIGSGHSGSTQGDQWMKDLSFMYAFIYANLFN